MHGGRSAHTVLLHALLLFTHTLIHSTHTPQLARMHTRSNLTPSFTGSKAITFSSAIKACSASLGRALPSSQMPCSITVACASFSLKRDINRDVADAGAPDFVVALRLVSRSATGIVTSACEDQRGNCSLWQHGVRLLALMKEGMRGFLQGPRHPAAARGLASSQRSHPA